MFFSLALGGFAADWATKEWVFRRLGMPGERLIWIWQGVLSLETHLNEGALFGMGQGGVPVYVVMSTLAATGIVLWLFWYRAAHDLLLTLALACVWGGILGNLFDRLGLPKLVWNYPPSRIGQPVYAVRDWIHFRIEGLIDWPVFNVADSLLVCGAGLLFWQAIRWKPAVDVKGPSPAVRDS